MFVSASIEKQPPPPPTAHYLLSYRRVCLCLCPSHCLPKRIVTETQRVFVLWVRLGGRGRGDEVGQRRGPGPGDADLGCTEPERGGRGVSVVGRANDGR